MKYKAMLIIMLNILHVYPGIDCIDNSEHLERPGDKKEWHSVVCNCSCEIIQAGVCTECGHTQNPHPLIVIESPRTKKFIATAQKLSVQAPKTLQDFVNNSVKPYLHYTK